MPPSFKVTKAQQLKVQQAVIQELTAQFKQLNKAVKATRAALIKAGGSVPGGPGKKFRGVDPLASRVLGFAPEYTTAVIIRGLAKTVTDWQKTAAGLGVSIDKTYKDNSSIMKELPGGVITSMDTLIEAMKAGLKDNTKGSLLLAAQSRLTGQDIGEAVEMMAKLESLGKVNSKVMNSLGTNLVDMAGTYQIQTSELIKTMEKMGESTKDFSLVGANVGALNEGVALLESALGKQFGPSIESLTKALLTTNMDTAIAVGMMGASNERSAAINAKTSMEFAHAVLAAARKAEIYTNKFIGVGGERGLIGLGISTQVLGDTFAKEGALISERASALGGSLFKTLQTNTKFTESIENLRLMALDPLVTAFTDYIGPIVSNLAKMEHGVDILRIAVATLVPIFGTRFLMTLFGSLASAGAGAGAISILGLSLPVILGLVSALVMSKKIFLDEATEGTEKNTAGILSELKSKNRMDLETSEFNKRSAEQIRDLTERASEQIKFNLQDRDKEVVKRLDMLIEVIRREKLDTNLTGGKK